MAMFGEKSIVDMTNEEFQEWKVAVERQRAIEKRFDERTAKVVASTLLHLKFFGLGTL